MGIKLNWNRVFIVVTLVCWLAAVGSSNAQEILVFDNGVGGAAGADGASRSDDDGLRRHANDVTLSRTTRISRVAWTGVYATDNTPPASDNFTVAIYADDGGQPMAGTPISQFFVGNNVMRADTGIDNSLGRDIYEFSAFINFRMLANTTYWISIYNNTAGENDDFFWARLSGGNSYRTTDSSASWELNDPAREMDFQLYEFPIVNNSINPFDPAACFPSDVVRQQIGAENFQVPRPMTVDRVEWRGAYVGPAPLTDVFQIKIYPDDNGAPLGSAPLATYETSDVNRTDLSNGFFSFTADIDFQADPNTQYWIAIYHSGTEFCWSSEFPTSSPFAFSRDGGTTWSSATDRQCDLVMYGSDTSPSNDNYFGPDVILPFSETSSNSAASTQTDEQQLENTGSTVWWYFTAPQDGAVTIDTFGSDFDTQLHIYSGFVSGATPADLTPVVNNDDTNDDTGSRQSQVTFLVEAGETYDIRVGGFRSTGAIGSGSEGSITLNGTFILTGDINLDENINFLDIAPFIAVLSSGGFQAEADCDANEEVNFLDIAPFIAILSGQ